MRWSRRCLPASRRALHRLLLRVLIAATAAGCAVAFSAKQDYFIRDHFGGPDLLAVLIVVAARIQPTLNINLGALQQIRRDILSTPEHDVGPIGFFFPIARCLIFPAAA